MWAKRAQIEKCQVYIASQRDPLYNSEMGFMNPEFLLWPDALQIGDTKEPYLDTHLVFEYNTHDEILGYRPPRTNRFYFVDDPNGAYVK